MHDTRAASAARCMSPLRCLLAAGVALGLLGFLADRAGMVSGAFPLLGCALIFAAAWWLPERKQTPQASVSATVSSPRPANASPIVTPVAPPDAGALFISSMSHDLRQPVQAAALFAATLSAQPLPEASRKLVSGIESAVEQLSEQIEAVFAIARLESGRQACSLTPLLVEESLSAAVGAQLDEAQERGLHLRHVPGRLRVKADQALLARALERMLLHALRTTREGGVVVGCRRRAGRAVIEVWDSSPGIAPELLGEALTPGGRYGPDLVDRGLGLVVAERCATRMGGRFSLGSRPGRGTVQRLELELA